MRRLETQGEKEKKEHRLKTVIGVILGLIMLLGTAGYAFMGFGRNSDDSGTKVTYNGLDFYSAGDYWQLNTGQNVFYFSYLPNETRSVILGKTVQDYSGKSLYFIEDSVAAQEISRNLGAFADRMSFACFEGMNCSDDNLPVKNCSSNVIIIRESNFSAITEEDNCVYIMSNDSVRDADAFMYRLFGIK